MMNRSMMIARFQELFGEDGGEIRVFFAPVPLNLVGEHTNYNGGHVLACAAAFGLWMAVRLRDDRIMRFSGINDENGRIRVIDLDDPERQLTDDDWGIYGLSAIRVFEGAGYGPLRGCDLLCGKDISEMNRYFFAHACYVVSLYAIRAMSGCEYISDLHLAELAQKTEDYCEGGECGILNAFSSVMGRKGYATLLDAKSGHYEYIPFKLDGIRIVITNSRVKHEGLQETLLMRKKQCERALKKLQTIRRIDALCDLTWDSFESCKDVIMNEEVIRRARHAVYENARTIRAANALRVGNLKRLGQMMFASHCSLRDEYGVSCPELDFLVDCSMNLPEVLGSRIYGPGLGACMLSMVTEAGLDSFKETIGRAYVEEFGVEPDFYICGTEDGAREILE